MFTCLLRTVFLYIFVSVSIRVMGKKQVGQLQPVEFVIILLLSELAAIPMQDMKISILYSVVPILTLIGLELLSSALGLRFRCFRSIFDGKPSIIVNHGKVDIEKMRQARYNIDELFTELRTNGISDLRSVDYAILETSGNMSVILNEKARPLTPGDINVNAKSEGYPCIVINDGKISQKSLNAAGITKDELIKLLKSNNVFNIKRVFYAVFSTAGDFYYQLKEDGNNA